MRGRRFYRSDLREDCISPGRQYFFSSRFFRRSYLGLQLKADTSSSFGLYRQVSLPKNSQLYSSKHSQDSAKLCHSSMCRLETTKLHRLVARKVEEDDS